MVRVAAAESTGVIGKFNPKVKNRYSSAKGLFQILDGTWKGYGCTGDPYNAEDSIACAVKIYARRGTADWVQSKYIWG